MSEQEKPQNLPATIDKAIEGLPLPWWAKTAKAVSRIIGTVLSPDGMRRVSGEIDKANAASHLSKVMTNAVAEKWANDPAMLARWEQRMLDQEFGRQERLETIAAQSVEELKLIVDQTSAKNGGADEPPQEEVSEDWQRRFASFAQDVSEPEMQQVWARILAGEIHRPGSYSYRTLRLVSEFDPAVALIFQEVAKDSFGGNAIFIETPGEWQKGPKYLNAVKLRDWGVTSEIAGQSERAFENDGTNRYWIWGKNYSGFLYFPVAPARLAVPIIQLTSAGSELLSLLPHSDELGVIKRIATAVLNQTSERDGVVCAIGRRIPRGIMMDEFLLGAKSDLPPA